MIGSYSYRTNTPAIWDGKVPTKYTRLLPHIGGGRILEIGAAEGVLSLLLAERHNAQVTALELRQERHEAALALQAHWKTLGRRVDGCRMVCGDIRNRLDLLDGVDTFVAIRTIYHLREDIDAVLAEVAHHVPFVVLSGNPNRAKRYAKGQTDDELGSFNFYAGIDGMSQALQRAGYAIGAVVTEGDPIVTGYR